MKPLLGKPEHTGMKELRQFTRRELIVREVMIATAFFIIGLNWMPSWHHPWYIDIPIFTVAWALILFRPNGKTIRMFTYKTADLWSGHIVEKRNRDDRG